MLDIEVAGAIAPKSQILVYFSTNDEQGFLAAIKAAVLDPPNPPSVLSISWGGPEPGWSQQTLQAVDRAFQDAGTLGVPVVVAAGDEGSTDGTGGLAVDFPASSPNAIACGGTFLQVNGGAVTESVWNDSTGSTGGGVSTFFSIPAYQANANVPAGPGGFQGRGTPDVAGNAASQSAYKVRVDGINTNEWGTSAVAPLWAGLIALCTQALGKPIADLHSFIYQAGMQQTAFNDITQGNNYSQGIQFYSAGAGWDPCTGLGTPNGQALLASLKAGVPTPAPGTGTTNPPGNNPPGSDLSTVATVAITAINAIVALVQTIAIGSDFAPPAGQPPSAAKAAGK
jgi:kumamolisin